MNTRPGTAADNLRLVQNVPGVYLLIDLDERPLYVGQSTKLRSRFDQHFVRQDSSVTADGLLDIYDVLRVYVWYAPLASLGAYEAALYSRFQPRWNRRSPAFTGPAPDLSLENADVTFGILDSVAQIAVRKEPLERIEAKLLHLVRAVRKARISGASPAVRRAITLHTNELHLLCMRELMPEGELLIPAAVDSVREEYP